MTTQTEALNLALEELAVRFSEGWHEGIKIDASDIMLLNKAAQALAQPEQEPVGWTRKVFSYDREFRESQPQPLSPEWQPCFTTPPQRKPLTYVDLRRIANQCGLGANEVSARTQNTVDNFARAIEAAHGIKE